ncbi:hypothetical protein [Aeromonas molluscorum]
MLDLLTQTEAAWATCAAKVDTSSPASNGTRTREGWKSRNP